MFLFYQLIIYLGPFCHLIFFLILIFPFIRFTRVISEPKTKSVLVPYRNYLFVKNSEEDEILSNWQNKNEEPFQQ